MFAFPSVGAWELWHSKADKIVNNFHGQNQFQFHGQNSHFVVKTNFLMVRPTNFVDHKISWSQNFLVNLHSIPMPKFYVQPYSIPILCSTPFHSNSIFMVSHDFMVSDSLDLPAPEVSHAFLLTISVV